MKILAYGTAWMLVISQWNDLHEYSYNPITPAPAGAVIITVLSTVILSVVTYKELTKGDK